MASPFAVFRRNQRMMLAVVGIATMIAFVFFDPIYRIMDRRGDASDPLVVKTDYGNFRRSELENLANSRQVVENFLRKVAFAVAQKMAAQGQYAGVNPRLLADNLFQNWHNRYLGRTRPPGEAAAVETLVLSKRAQEAGLVVSDHTINDLLSLITEKKLSKDDFKQIIASLRAGHTIGQGYLFEALRRELLASQYSSMFRLTLGGIPPAQRWDYFERLNQKADALVLSVSAERFLKDVPDPNDDKLLAFFEQHKDQLQQPDSPIPGFKVPAKAKFQYFKAYFNTFLERATAEVTLDEMKEYYEKNKDRFREQASPATEKKASESTEENAKDDADKDKSTEEAKTKPPAQPDEKSKPAIKPAPAAKSSTPPAASNPAKPPAKTPAVPAQPPAKAPAGKKSSRIDSQPTIRLVALLADDDTKKDEADADPTDTADDKPADTESDEKKKEEPKYKPFEDVKEQIHKDLARQKANKMISEAFERIRAKLREYSSARSSYLINKEENPDQEPPEPLDVAAMAKEEDLEIKETDLISAYDTFTKTEIGESYNLVLDPSSPMGFREIQFVPTMFSSSMGLYKPLETRDPEDNHYLSWKIEDAPEKIPALDDVRNEVVRAYKMKEARELARKQAEQYAKEAREAKKSLKEAFAGKEGLDVTQTGEFTWMTTGDVAFDPQGNQPRLSSVNGVKAAGEDFMRSVFQASTGQIEVAWNQPKDIVYVIEVLSFDPPPVDLERQFIVEDFRKYAQVAVDDERQIYLSWLDSLDQQAGVEWLELPLSRSRVE